MKFDPTLYLVTDSTGRTDDDFLAVLNLNHVAIAHRAGFIF